MKHRVLNLLVMAAIVAALLVPAVAAGSTPSSNSPAPAAAGIEVHVPNFVFDPVLSGEPKLDNVNRFDGQEAGFRLVQFYGPTQDA